MGFLDDVRSQLYGTQPAAAAQPVPIQSNPNFDTSSPYNLGLTQTAYEKQAGVNPPGYQSLVGDNGQLKAPYTVDPSQSGAFQKEQSVAMSDGLSPWAQLQMQSNAANTLNQRDQSNAQSLGATNQAEQQMMATGGGSNSGASAFLAMQGARNATMANQNIGNQSNLNNLNIQATDAQNKQSLLGQVATTQTAAQAANAQSAINDASNANAFTSNRYNQQMSAYGAQQTANAQRDAANAQKGGLFK